MKKILEAVKESLAIIAVIFACSASVFCVMRLGEWATLLIAGCAYIIYIGLAIAIKRMDKEEENKVLQMCDNLYNYETENRK